MNRWKAHRGKIVSLSLSRDSRYLASVTGSGRETFIWNPLTGELVTKLEAEPLLTPEVHHSKTRSVSFAKCQDWLSVGRGTWIELWSTVTWKLLGACQATQADGIGFPMYGLSSTYGAAISPMESPIAVSIHQQGVVLYRLQAASDAIQISPFVYFVCANTPDIAFSPDGTELVEHTAEDLEVRRTFDGALLRRCDHARGNYVGPVTYSPDGSRIVYASTKVIESHPASLDRPGEVVRFKGHTNKVWVLQHTPDGRTLISASSDGTLRLWDVATAQEQRQFEFGLGKIVAASVSSDGTIAAVGGETGEIVVWDLGD